MSSDVDPFEQAARRERASKTREEREAAARKQRELAQKMVNPGIGTWLRVFLPPYALLMIIRGLRFDWGVPNIGESLYTFLFGSFWIAAATGFILLLLWIRIMTRGRGMDWF